MLVCEANQMVVELSYGRSVAVQAENLWRRLREMLFGRCEEKPEKSDAMIKVSREKLKEWASRLDRVGADFGLLNECGGWQRCPQMEAASGTINAISEHIKNAVLNTKYEE